MASNLSIFSASLALLSFFVLCSAIADVAAAKRTRLHFYFHEINAGPNTSVVRVAQANTTLASPTSFGALVVADNPLTKGPELTSKLVGRAQGIYTSASQEELAFMTSLNFAFTAGKYNGSVLTVLGRFAIALPVREMSVVGGSGYFRLARGYARIRTHRMDQRTGLVTVEYNVTVIHPR
ncbi:hypothetical protein Taro_052468 [Colocasia esculenta]|uniref:Dirigent protein n=1 Tax=Colocasia esculenta TaxID=4460 RepID=A0A843XIP0_COLES|nr:hypothetical protein [Colocasia esculenta]